MIKERKPNCEEKQNCDSCPAQCESRSISITLPKKVWELLELIHDDGGPSPGNVIRAISGVILVDSVEAALNLIGQGQPKRENRYDH